MGSQWPNLPLDLLESIARLLESAEDFTTLRHVCSPWRSAIDKDMFAGKSRALLLIPVRDDEPAATVIEPYHRISRMCLWAPKQLNNMTIIGVGFGWMLIVEKKGVARLENLSGHLVYLPNFKSFPDYGATYFIQRAALSNNPSETSNFELAVIVKERLGFWWPWLETWKKEQVSAKNIIYHKGRLCVVDAQGNISIWEPTSFEKYGTRNRLMVTVDSPRLITDERVMYSVSLYLVRSSKGRLLLITRKVHRKVGYYETRAFGVISLDLNRRAWEEIHDLDGDAVFVGNNGAFAAPAFGFLPDCVVRPNRIYFTDDNFISRCKGRGRDAGVYDIADASFEWFNLNQVSKDYPPSLWIDTGRNRRG